MRLARRERTQAFVAELFRDGESEPVGLAQEAAEGPFRVRAVLRGGRRSREGGDAVVEGGVEFRVPDGELDGIRDLRDEMEHNVCGVVARRGECMGAVVHNPSIPDGQMVFNPASQVLRGWVRDGVPTPPRKALNGRAPYGKNTRKSASREAKVANFTHGEIEIKSRRGCFRYGEFRSVGARAFPECSQIPKLPGAEATVDTEGRSS